MALQSNNTVVAIVEETTEGTPVAPSAGTDYIAVQEGFSLTPSFNVLENAELTGSIGTAKTVKGIEEPVSEISHYLRSSGAEGTAPNYGLLMKASLGSETARGTERDTVVGSTVSVVNVDAGEGAEFVRGDALLVKQSGSVYEIRNVLSVSTDALTLAQDLAVAPGTGINLGRNVRYAPINVGHPTFSLWDYRGNAAAGVTQLISGCRSVSMAIEANAGEFINATYSIEGIEFYYNPIEITASDVSIDFDDGGGEENATITAGMYKDPYELASAIETAMNALTGDTITVTFEDSGANAGKYSIATSGGTLSLLWNTGTNTATTVGDKIGFTVAADDTGATSYVADSVIDKSSPFTPSFDSADPLVAKSNEVLIGPDAQEITCFDANSVSVTIEHSKTDLLSVCSESGKSGSLYTQREITVEIAATLQDHQAEEFKNFRANDNIVFTYNGGEKSGGNWVAGKAINIHSPTMVIDEFELVDNDGVVDLNMTLSSYVSSGLNEIFVNTL